MDTGRPTTTNKARALIGVVQYYRDMWPRRYYILAPLEKAYSGPKGGKMLWNDSLEDYLKELKCMVSDETLLSFPDWKIPFTVHTDASYKKLGAVISQNNKPIALFSKILIKPQRNYTTTKKELLVIVEYLKTFHGIIFGYEIKYILGSYISGLFHNPK